MQRARCAAARAPTPAPTAGGSASARRIAAPQRRARRAPASAPRSRHGRLAAVRGAGQRQLLRAEAVAVGRAALDQRQRLQRLDRRARIDRPLDVAQRQARGRPAASTTATAPRWRLSTSAPRRTSTRTGLLIVMRRLGTLATIRSRTIYTATVMDAIPAYSAHPATLPPQAADLGLSRAFPAAGARRRGRAGLSRRPDPLEPTGTAR